MARTEETARTHFEKEQHYAAIAEMKLRGYSQAAIAKKLNLSDSQVSRDLRVIEQRWRKSAERDLTIAKGQKLAELDHIKTESWEAWDRSQQEVIEQSASKTKRNGDAMEEAERKSKTQVGDPRFLEIVHKAIASQSDILGLFAPTKIAQTDPSGNRQGIRINSFEHINDDDLDQIITNLEAAVRGSTG